MKSAAKIFSKTRTIALDRPDDFCGWRDAARALLIAGVPPEQVVWREQGAHQDLFAEPDAAPTLSHIGHPDASPIRVSQNFLDLAEKALLHSDPMRFSMLYQLLWRQQGRARLLEDQADPHVRRVTQLARTVGREIHKMRAFVRFRLADAQTTGDGEHYIAWFEPQHHILRANAEFFVNRFSNMRWSILTPRGSLHWDGAALCEGPPAERGDAPSEDATETLWRSFYASIFNPSRLKVAAMLKEMPRRYWKNLPEAELIPGMIATAQAREAAMITAGADPFAAVDRPKTLDLAAQAIANCRRCAIGCNGTRAVPGEGARDARLMIVGEQPGDEEECVGRPFVGPAGRLLDRHLSASGLVRREAWVTNAVKHFKFEDQRKGEAMRRIHRTPTAGEIDTCRWWLEAERALVKPRFILALGASAGRALGGRSISVESQRGRSIALPDGGQMWVTAHPSALLRMKGAVKDNEERRFAADLSALAAHIAKIS